MFLKISKDNSSDKKIFEKNKKKNKVKHSDEKEEDIRCYEGEGKGHKAHECPIMLKRKGKKIANQATLSDSDIELDDSGGESPHEKCVAFMASHVNTFSLSHGNEDTCKHESLNNVSSNLSECEGEITSEDEGDLR